MREAKIAEKIAKDTDRFIDGPMDFIRDRHVSALHKTASLIASQLREAYSHRQDLRKLIEDLENLKVSGEAVEHLGRGIANLAGSAKTNAEMDQKESSR